MPPLLSIVVPVCNVEVYLGVCLESILNQTIVDFEVICVDDGSTDGSGGILDEYAARDSRVRVIHQKNAGYGSAMNVGIEHATGRFLGIVESDDFIHSGMYERLISVAECHHVPLVKCGWYEYWSDECMEPCGLGLERGLAGVEVVSPMEDAAVFMHHPSIWAALYDLQWLREHRLAFLPTPGASYQDNSFFFKTFMYAERVAVVPEQFVYYRQSNPGSSSNSGGKAFCLYAEMDEIWSSVQARCRAFGDAEACRLRAIFIQYAHKALFFNFLRVDHQYKYAVLKRTSCALRLWMADGVVDWSLMPARDRKEIRRLARCPFLYAAGKTMMAFLKKLCRLR